MTDLTNDYGNRLDRVTEPQYYEALAALAGSRPLCIVEYRKAPATYAWLVELPDPEKEIHAHEGAEGPEMVVSAPGFFTAYLDLLDRRALYGTRSAFQVALGTLLGAIQDDPTLESTREAAHAWWITTGYCDCSKCGGPLTRAERLSIDAHKRRTQYHAV